jgi:hypothetical protein
MSRSKDPVTVSISQALFTLAFLLVFFTILNGYALNLVSGYRANYWLVTIGVVIELILVLIAARRWMRVEGDSFELAGFAATVVGVWIYFIAPSLPTLLPPTQSEDAVRIYLQVLFTYPDGKLVSWYPAGSTFFVATLAHWLQQEPLRLLHPTVAAMIAASAGAVYGMTCDLFGKERINKIWALIAPALVFAPWSYFAGIVDWEQYFFAQVFAQFFTLAALWYTMSYARRASAIWIALVGFALLGVLAAYPVFAVLPFGLLMLVVVVKYLRDARGVGRALPVLCGVIASLVLAVIALEHGGIIDPNGLRVSTTGDVGAGGVASPSLEAFGGPFFLLLAIVGIPLAWRANAMGKTIFAFLVVWALQFIALVVLQPFINLSNYRVDKTLYILVFPLAISGAMTVGSVLGLIRISSSLEARRNAILAPVGLLVAIVIAVGVVKLRPPIVFSPLTESELDTAQWAKQHLDTYQVNYLDPLPIRAYWVAFGLWRETLPNEWFQWIPAGTKLGPESFDQWYGDPAWGNWLFVSDVSKLGSAPVKTLYNSGPSAIVEKASFAIPVPSPSHQLSWHFGSTIKLMGYDLPREKISAGDTMTLTTYTESIYPPPATVAWRMELVDHQGNPASRVELDPFGNKYPVQRWPQGRSARDEWQLPIDARAAPGVYDLRLGLFKREGGDLLDAFPVQAEGLGKPVSTVPVARLKIPLPAPTADELRQAKPVGTRVGDNFMLSDYTLEVDRAARRVHLALYWQSVSKSRSDYTVFVHILDSSGKVVVQSDREPLDGNYPTSVWDAGEIIKDEYDLTIPSDASTPLKIEIGMYAQPSLKRLPVGDSDRILLDLPF